MKLILAATLAFLAFSYRLLPHEANLGMMGALALFCGAQFKRTRGFLIFLAALILSDFVLGFYSYAGWVYASYLCIALLGRNFLQKPSPKSVLAGALSASFVFFIVSNFGYWLSGNAYPLNSEGLFQAYVAGLPFLRTTLLSDALFSAIFFSAAQLLSTKLSPKSYSRLAS